ncbi:MAG: ABC transporter permease [Gemmatimonadaceae bacterium]|nr:ABC transporter permease [Gemmatimonadaceae bacterium]MCU0634732.1 ABC transporter permease [Gemmatimonadaceae bacterium]
MRLEQLGDQLRENVGIALGALRASKARSVLTILGVVIGVATVMAMAAIVQGIRAQIVQTIEVAGPTTFYVLKKFSQTPLNPDQLPKDVRIRPDVSEREALRIAQLPEVQYASLWAQILSRLEFEGVRTQGVSVFGADNGYMAIQGGELIAGRWFTRNEQLAGTPVVVLQENSARRLFGQADPLGKSIRIGGRPAEVIGIWREPENIFAPPGQAVGAVVPYRVLDQQFRIDRTNGLWIPVRPRPGVRVADAQAAVTTVLREMRRLRPADGSTFDLVTQDQILDTFNNLTGAFFLVMIVLSAVSLMVGGIGVMAIMTVSVTSRTREIGVRKALGATRRDILLQFLVEAMTLTGLGGLLGIALGLLVGKVTTLVMGIDSTTPTAFTLVAVGVSVGIGLVFGLLPARRAARLDPIEALRYE